MRDTTRAEPKRNAGGADRDRTGDPLLAKQVLSQLSYGPEKHCSCSLKELVGLKGMVGLGRFELPTSRLSGVRSNQLSYRPPKHHPANPKARRTDTGTSCLTYIIEGDMKLAVAPNPKVRTRTSGDVMASCDPTGFVLCRCP